jgi:phosphatidylethanolamine/phosphatidyl-N-methylethanolamine N-methyltransferase
MFDLHPGSTLTFLRNIRRRPKATGAIFPSGRVLAKAMAGQVDAGLDGMVLELGPGTGVFTRALLDHGIAPERLVLVEYNADFVRYLRRRFPGVTVIHGSAFEVGKIWKERNLSACAAVVSGLPLLNFKPEERQSLLAQCLDLLQETAPFVQFTYSQMPSVKPTGDASVALAKRIWLNVPPATVWVYRRHARAA